MRIEHVACTVEDPVEVAAWYCRNLGLVVKRRESTRPWTHFLADDQGRVMLEIYNNPACPAPDYRSWDPLRFHLAFVCEDIPAAVERLVKAGATVHTAPLTKENGDVLAMLRDPWGLPIQLARRGQPMLD